MIRVNFKKGSFESKRFEYIKSPIYVVDIQYDWAAIKFTNCGIHHILNVPVECLEFDELPPIKFNK